MANRIKNGTKFSKDVRRGKRVKCAFAVRRLRELAGQIRTIAAFEAMNKKGGV